MTPAPRLSRALRAAGAALGLLALAACGHRAADPSATDVPLGQEFTLAPGTFASIKGTGLTILFEGVDSDSRCPADVTCVWEGDAVVAVRVASGREPASRHALHTAHIGPREATQGGYVVRLVALAPARASQAPPDPAAYRATFVVSRS